MSDIKINAHACIQRNPKTGFYESIDVTAVVDEIRKHLNIVTVLETEEMLQYVDGIYVGGAEKKLSNIIVHNLRNLRDWKNRPMYNQKVMNEIISQFKYMTYVETSKFDTDLDIINMKNGLYNWRTNEFRPHTPDYLSRIQVPVYYNPDATCKVLDAMLRDILQPEDYIKILELIAYCYYRRYDIQKAFILYGPRRTGKSTFLSMLGNMIGETNFSSVSFNDIGNPNKRFLVAELYGKMVNMCGELDSGVIDKVSTFNQLTSNYDRIQVERKYKDPFKFVNFAKLVWATNSLAKVFEKSNNGFYRRVELILFINEFKACNYDQARLDAIYNPVELSGLFNKCIKLLPKLLERHSFTNECSEDEIIEMYKAISDPIQSFANDYLQPCPDGQISCDELYTLFAEYCKNYKTAPDDRNKFDIAISKHIKSMKQGEMYVGRKKICAWNGVKLKGVLDETTSAAE